MLAEGRRQRTRYFTLLAAPGGPAPRLGLVVGRRVSARAVVRNRLKRIVREAFRQAGLPAMDVVVLAHPGLGAVDTRDLRSDLDCGFEELTKQCAAS